LPVSTEISKFSRPAQMLHDIERVLPIDPVEPKILRRRGPFLPMIMR
jgi:hypothetical protein